MRYGVMAAALASLGLGTMPARAQPCPEARLVQNWYLQYLQRPADECGLNNWVRQLRCGKPPECVEAAILGSEEYHRLHGCTPEGFVLGLYADVLGRAPCERDLGFWVGRLSRSGCREELAKAFLCAARPERAAPPPPVGAVPERVRGWGS
jgi:hypothetical protein